MLKHIVMFKFKDTAQGRTKAENLEAARARMLALKEEIPEHPSHVAFGQFVKELREPDGRVSIDYEV